jgi:hypothetical protein
MVRQMVTPITGMLTKPKSLINTSEKNLARADPAPVGQQPFRMPRIIARA